MKRDLAKWVAVLGFFVWATLNPVDIRAYAMETQTGEAALTSDDEQSESLEAEVSGTSEESEKYEDVASESVNEEADNTEIESVTVQTEARDNEIISVILPLVEDRNPFSFFIDPLNIFYNTFEKRDAEDSTSTSAIHVEEDTNLLFYNRSGDYTLSSRSDLLTITNQSTVPIEVTITARLDDYGNINIMQDADFEGSDTCDLYLALTDSDGNEVPLSDEGEASVCIRLQRAPIAAYAYEFDEDSGQYRYVHLSEDVDFDTYSFGLRGACNKKGDWTTITGNPHISVSWEVEPLMTDEQDQDTEGDSLSGRDDQDKNKEDATEALKNENMSDEVDDVDRKTDVSGDDSTMENPTVDTDVTTDETKTDSLDKNVSEDVEERSKDYPGAADDTANTSMMKTDDSEAEPTSKEEESQVGGNISTVSVNAVDVTGENTDG